MRTFYLPVLCSFAFQNKTFSWNKNKGSHGYDNRLLSMKPIFMAQGPDIKRGYEIEPFMSLDLYPLTATLLGITPAPNNGTLRIVQDMIRKYTPRTKAVIEANNAPVATPVFGISLMTTTSLTLWRCLA